MTTQTSFSFGAMIKSGYQLFKNHAKFIILAGLATFVVQALLQLIQNGAQMHRGGFLMGLIVTIFVALIGLIITIGWSKVFLKLGRGTGAVWNDFKSEPTLWLKFIKAYLWYIAYLVLYVIAPFIICGILFTLGALLGFKVFSILATIIGALSFVGVAIYFSIRYQFLKYVILDNPEMGGRTAFKHAGTLTKGSLLQLFGFMIVLGLLNLLGLICLVVGLAVTIPTTKLAEVKVYEYLKEKNN